jgi:hypothetical protein
MTIPFALPNHKTHPVFVSGVGLCGFFKPLSAKKRRFLMSRE